VKKKNAPRIPKKGINPERLKLALENKNKAYTHVVESLGNVTKMCHANSQMLGQLVVMFEVLKDKGLITRDEINEKFAQLQADKEIAEQTAQEVINGNKSKEEDSETKEESDSANHSNENPADTDRSQVQSEDSRPDEDSQSG